MGEAVADHWDDVHRRLSANEASWYQADPAVSVRLVTAAVPDPASASVVDVGAGTAVLADRLLDLGWSDVTVLDVSEASLAAVRDRLGDRIRYVLADVRSWSLGRTVDVWHDRAVFHFLTSDADRDRYVSIAASTVRAGGALVIGTFAEDGPQRCSGLPTARYDATSLAARFSPAFDLEHSEREEHRTPRGSVQPFTWVLLRRTDRGRVDEMVARARSGLDRVAAEDLAAEMAAGALVVDTRPVEQRSRDGELPGAVVIDRNVLEWRLDPTSPHRIEEIDDPDRRVIIVCNEGYSSSLAAATMRELGLRRATDLVGGYQAWLRRRS